jgi:hypothetical protein
MSCHGASQMSGLDIRTRDTLLHGGKRGSSVIPGNPQGSLLYQAMAHQGELKMPLGSKSPLPVEELEIIKKWIQEGAAWPSDYVAAKRPEPNWWSFKKLRRPAVPTLKPDQPAANPIDAFIFAKLKEKGLKPAPPADKVTLVRRAYFDLIGLPPTPEQVSRFVQDSSPDAWAKLIDTLLASPQYGERWARHWLDVVRYADSAGYEGDVYYPNAWRYRDYVIKSFNDDKPYDRFVQEQVAGDELWPDDLGLKGLYGVPPEKLEHLEARVGTELYTFGPEIQESHQDYVKLRYERLTDAVDTTGSAFLGLTLKCARCHDHKFDPLSQKDYYRLQAVFAGSTPVQVPVVTGMSTTHRDENYHYLIALDEARIAYRLLEKKVKDRVIQSEKASFSPAAVKAFETPSAERTPAQAELAAPVDKAYSQIKVEDNLTAAERPRYDSLMQRLAKAVLEFPEKDDSHKVRYDGFFDVPSATVLRDFPVEMVPDTYVYGRGDMSRPLTKANPGLPGALLDNQDPSDLAMGPGGPRFREQFALWLTKPDHPLTARVMVNRIWQGHFGRGLVATENDFGHQGQPPSHPELLDWLATEFVRQNWSIKAMHRLIMLSKTYQLTSRFVNPANSRIDPENVYIWRMNRRRLEGEEIWDAIHTSAGDLNLRMYGRPIMPPISKPELIALRRPEEWVTPGDPQEANRRGIYVLVRRNFSFPLFDRFDMPVNAESCPRRDVTTVAPQVLWTLNNQIAFDQAQRLAARLVKEAGDNPTAWIDKAWRITLARAPTEQEKREALAMMQKLATQGSGKQDLKDPVPEEFAKIGPARGEALTKLCLAIFNLDEFIYVD